MWRVGGGGEGWQGSYHCNPLGCFQALLSRCSAARSAAEWLLPSQWPCHRTRTLSSLQLANPWVPHLVPLPSGPRHLLVSNLSWDSLCPEMECKKFSILGPENAGEPHTPPPHTHPNLVQQRYTWGSPILMAEWPQFDAHELGVPLSVASEGQHQAGGVPCLLLMLRCWHRSTAILWCELKDGGEKARIESPMVWSVTWCSFSFPWFEKIKFKQWEYTKG